MDALCLCDWTYRRMRKTVDQRLQQFLNAPMIEGKHPLIDQTITQLQEYFNGDRIKFELPLLLCGSPFQKSVWNGLLKVPYGTTSTYSELTNSLGDPKAIRAVASANGANSIAIIIPCHRIIGVQGDLVGYAGGLQAKKQLLLIEEALPQLDLFT
ncbi:MAG: Methylated-DNA--protein-cysteine methyltransferase, inducible [Bacteroidota bacterium]